MDKARYEQAREAGRRARQAGKGRVLGWDAEGQERQQRRSAA